MKKGDILEQQRLGLEVIIGKFFPTNFTIKGRKLILSDETEILIQNVRDAVELSNTLNRPLPDSTRDLARYGPVFLDEIFSNLEDYSIIKQQRMLAKRKGSFSVTIATWDKRKIENTLIKAPKPMCKSEKDKKVLKKFKKEILTAYKENNEEEMLQITNLLSKFFLFPSKDSTISAQNIKKAIKTLLNHEKQLNSRIQELTITKTKLEENSQILAVTKQELANHESVFEASEIGKKYLQILHQINELNQDEELRQFLRIFDNAGRRYYTYVSKQGSALPMQLQTLELFLNDPLNSRFSSEMFSEYVDLFCQSSEELFVGKKWFRQFGSAEALRTYFLESEVTKKFNVLRERIKTKADIEEEQEYEAYTSQKNELSNKIDEHKKVELELQIQVKNLESMIKEIQ
ncbi:MAG: hypothetical protein ACFFCQ_06100, partial [Promethearchaeota archaeon]